MPWTEDTLSGKLCLDQQSSSSVCPSARRAQPPGEGLRLKFVGMMGYVTRSDQSLLVALPGAHRTGHYSHVPFLMAPAGSAIAKALGLTAMPGVVAGAFDMTLADAPAGAFVYRCLDGVDLEVDARRRHSSRQSRVTAGADAGHRAGQAPAQQSGPLGAIDGERRRRSPRQLGGASRCGKGLVVRRASATADRCHDLQQPIGIVRLNVGSRVASSVADNAHPADLWIVSAAAPRRDVPNPKRLEHGHLLFEFFADAEPITPTCETAEGRITFATEMPCSSGSASMGDATARLAPPHVDLCPGGGWCCP